MRRAGPALLCLVALAAGGCDSSDGGGGGGKTTAKREPAPDPAVHRGRIEPADPHDTAVIRKWADTLRAGKVAGAAGYFSVPSVAANGGRPIDLRTRTDTRLFNKSLPCGAVLMSTRRIGPFTVGIFRLTERPGGACGAGVGQRAATAFRIEHGKIAEWRRVPYPTEPAPDKKPPKV